MWLLQPGVAACPARVANYFVKPINLPGATPNVSYGVELEGCQAPPSPEN